MARVGNYLHTDSNSRRENHLKAPPVLLLLLLPSVDLALSGTRLNTGGFLQIENRC